MYTHRITFTRNHPTLGAVQCSFRTMADAVARHLAALAGQPDVGMVMAEELAA
jgi:hypothetical protein